MNTDSQLKSKSSALVFIFPILIGVVLIVGVVARFSYLNPAIRTPDEQVYALYADEIIQNGPLGLVNLLDAYAAEPVSWIYPPPTRAGYIYFLAFFSTWTNKTPREAGSFLSAVFSALTLLLFVFLGLRARTGVGLLVGLMFYAVSPMDLAIARRTWQESIMSFLSLVFFLISVRVAKKFACRSGWYYFAILSIAALFMKETGFAMAGILAAGLCVYFISQKRFREALFVIFVETGAFILWFFFFWKMTGNPLGAAEMLSHVKDSIPTNAYAVQFQAGSLRGLLEGLAAVSPGAFLLFLTGLAASLKRRGDGFLKAAVLYANAWILFYLLVPYSVNLRYLSVIYFAYYLTAAFGATALWEGVRRISVLRTRRAVWILMAAVFIGLAMTDYANFRHLFINRQAIDLTTPVMSTQSIYSRTTTI